jgi:hypothetical protein
MTEKQWLACTDPDKMLAFLKGKASDRKLRLFAVACVRRVGHLLIERRSLEAVDLAEQFAEGRSVKTDLTNKRKQLNDGVKGGGTARFVTVARKSALSAGWKEPKAGAVAQAWSWAWSASRELLRVDTAQAALETAVPAAIAAAWDVLMSLQEIKMLKAAKAAERKVQATLLRDIIGPLPFREVRMGPVWLTWNGSTVEHLAEEVYEGRELPVGTLDATRLAVLADALEEAGCADQNVLDHLRGPGPHARGCWAVDLVLGKS